MQHETGSEDQFNQKW